MVKVSPGVRQPPAGGKPGQPSGITAPPRGRPWPRIRWAIWLLLTLPGFTRSSLPVVAGALTLSAYATPASRLCLPLAVADGPVWQAAIAQRDVRMGCTSRAKLICAAPGVHVSRSLSRSRLPPEDAVTVRRALPALTPASDSLSGKSSPGGVQP